ncbi:DUF3467 domain-containing protein [Candidatus Woesearchaeota archaeon]|nr:DUF3467 domain-containing protein [Candidatus Woesearchaeota archaeon]
MTEIKKENKINFDIVNGTEFFSDDFAITHTPVRFYLDFKRAVPRLDIRNRDFQPMVISHNVVILDPFMAKNLIELLQQNLQKYEKQFGKIKPPKALEKANKKNKKPKDDTTKEESPVYFG